MNMEREEKLAYESPESEIIDLDHDDVITTSNPDDEGEGGNTSSGLTQAWF